MKVILQRVSRASVDIKSAEIQGIDAHNVDAEDLHDTQPYHAAIGAGCMLLVGVADGDGEREVEWLAHKISHLRVFEDSQGKMNRSIHDVGGQVLSISQFTLFADVKRGNRPSFVTAGKPEHAKTVWLAFNEALRAEGLTVQEGRFGAHMQIALVNDGPVTIVFDTEEIGL
ncbi:MULTISPECIES: D-aminoacyl-tRNA deacylase [Bifidobacterium]|jgi:D-tyrosyl-tRNA(Tyr) deacylase|uniref:D-aminoacyl-tRNA deacylase n=1 Tax=Bifidobacterium tibiigranuli TaxID=2172043 RepID=A0A5N6S3E8_9BIFI|nr:D-aminoacyl-tRNA deacylase [Bifidobacterium tibiigranuli]KAE8127103.1 D-tyrosyl-tRNA(Tyr) deacylase [Bifidobacterium tibiigranuli]KAE8127674.1 D-tyrosyl-tRNA(Tyr) deacylase [Bifidobacterium tibiigranuli]MCH3974169.1 D-aminoacyl-tRNA deacylase [Bifidobacterium tibiigranuli]MCH4188732.1 D-aminoacyl-tRNA deacylase [Bifidobacterium tibiigranuli]MCH4203363.1 D-aminoacyl-tRNA deacylase [Bifidobacterium tibiigranuli]